jgi:outer membrane protein assembly factor BamB
VVYLRGPAGAPVPRRGAWGAGRVLALGAGALLLAACGADALPPTPSPAPQGLAPLEAAAPPAPAAFPLAAGDWPMYGHDPARTNDNPDETLLRPDNVAALAPDWQAAIGMGPAPASAAPSVAGGRVYAGSSAPTGPNFLSFDALTGAPAWGVRLGSAGTCFNVGIGATPAISGSLVVAGGSDAAYYGLDAATGATRWRAPLGAGASAYPWASPLLAYGRAYLGVASGCDNPSVRGAVRAVSLSDGQTLADRPFVPDGQAGAGIWNSPALTPDGQTLVATTGEDFGGYNGAYNRAMVALDPWSLAILDADQQGPTDADKDYATSPIIFHDAQGRTLVAAHHKDEVFYAYDLDDLRAGPIWSRQTGSIIGMMPAYDPAVGAGGTLFLIDGTGRLLAVDPATGADRWPPVAVGSARGNMALAGGMVFLNTGAAGVSVVAEASGRLLAHLQPAGAGPSYSGVVVAHGVVYWISGPYLNAWTLPAP